MLRNCDNMRENSKLKIGYFGDGQCGANALHKLISKGTYDFEICFVVVRNNGQSEEIIEIANNNGIEILKDCNVNDPVFLKLLRGYEADLYVVNSFDQVFKREILSIPPRGVINCHSGKLPYYRGRCPIIWALINGEREFGITVHFMDEGIDTGPIVLQRTFEITDEDDFSTLSQKDADECADIIFDAVNMIKTGDCNPIDQASIDPIGMYCGGRRPGDEIINWNQSSRDIFNFVRALCQPGPRAATFRDGQRFSIDKVKEVQGVRPYKGIPGQVIGRGPHGPYVKTMDTMVEIIDYDSSLLKIRTGDRLG